MRVQYLAEDGPLLNFVWIPENQIKFKIKIGINFNVGHKFESSDNELVYVKLLFNLKY